MSQTSVHTSAPGTGKFVLKSSLAIIYGVACSVAENVVQPDRPDMTTGIVISAVVLVPLVVCGLMYLLWLRRADEFQKAMEYRAAAGAGLGGVVYLVTIKLLTYFVPAVSHVPSLAVISMVLVYWISGSHRLNVRALKA
jgi:hypothetical protein